MPYLDFERNSATLIMKLFIVSNATSVWKQEAQVQSCQVLNWCRGHLSVYLKESSFPSPVLL